MPITKEKIESIMCYLLHHNKNYTQKQYYMLLALEELLKDKMQQKKKGKNA